MELHEVEKPPRRRILVRRKRVPDEDETEKLPVLGPKKVMVARKIRPGQTLKLNRKRGGTVRMPSSSDVLSLPETLVRKVDTVPGPPSIDDASADHKNILGDVEEFQETFRERHVVPVEPVDDRIEGARQVSLYRCLRMSYYEFVLKSAT